MPNTKISALAPGAAVSGTDVFPNVQTAGVGPVKTTAAQIGAYVWANPTGTPALNLTNATGLPVGGISATGTPSASTYLRGDGTWSAASGSMTYPGAGIAASTGAAWGTSYTTSGSGTVLALATSPTLVTPILGTPTSGTLTNCTGLPLTTGVTGLLPVANGGTGTATPSLVAGTNVTISGTWPNQTINASGGGGGTPGGSNTQVQFNNSGAFGGSANLTWNGSTLSVTGQIAQPILTLTDAATITWNLNSGAAATVTLGAAGRTLTPSNLVAGSSYILFVKQDATGGRTITTWTNFKWVGGVAPVLSTAPNAVDLITAFCDGTYLYAAPSFAYA